MLRYNTGAVAALLLTPFLFGPGTAQEAGEYVCSVSKAVECDSGLGCGDPAHERPAPTFLHVDVNDRVITLLAPSERRGETTPIDHLEADSGRLILGGLQAGRSWSLVFPEEGGNMTLTANLGDAGWVVFGQCIAAEDLAP